MDDLRIANGCRPSSTPGEYVCRCREGYASRWDGKCGHCRTPPEYKALLAYQRRYWEEIECSRGQSG